jgi:4-hydroxyproline epimerase
MQKISVIDSHTGGEPTRVVVSGFPDLGTGSYLERRVRFDREFDHLRRAMVNEPRGSDVLVGALLLPPSDPRCVAGTIFFNNVGSLGMCGHGTIGLVVTLGYLKQITAGKHWLETPVGLVGFDYDGRNGVTIQNVPSYRLHRAVKLMVPDLGPIEGDIAWGGNWFFLVDRLKLNLDLASVEELTRITWAIRRTLQESKITGENGEEIDHIELFGPPVNPDNHSRNFVLCPGGAYDRSPCGTGTSAKLACLFAEGKLQPGQLWRQESITGSVFVGSVEPTQRGVIPTIRGEAFITGEATLLLDPDDPLKWGFAR